jgi:hypothetical protein
MNLQNPLETALDTISIDLYNKKVFITGSEGTSLTFKCATINELVELKEQCAKLLKTKHFLVR